MAIEEIAMQHSDGNITHPSNIIFMTVLLTNSFEGPLVMIHGEEGDDRYHCTYVHQPEWVSARELLDGENPLPVEKPRGSHH